MPAQLAAPSASRIRHAIASDAKAIHALEQAAFSPPIAPLSMRAIRYNLTNPRAIALVADVPPFLAAWSLTLVRESTAGHRSARLYSIAVDPSHRGQGLARKLLTRSIDLVQQARTNVFYLEVSTANPRAIALYHTAGFETIRHLPDYYAPSHHALRMRQRL